MKSYCEGPVGSGKWKQEIWLDLLISACEYSLNNLELYHNAQNVMILVANNVSKLWKQKLTTLFIV